MVKVGGLKVEGQIELQRKFESLGYTASAHSTYKKQQQKASHGQSKVSN